MTKFYVDGQGRYIGGFDGAAPPIGSIEVPTAPDHAGNLWIGGAWQVVQSVPQSVTRRQGLQALFLAGITEAIIEAKIIELLDGDARELSLIEFRTSQTFERGRPLVLQMGAGFGLDLDAIFVTASSIP